MNTLNKRISTLATSIFIMVSPLAQGLSYSLPGANTPMFSATVNQNPIQLAANEEDTAGDNAQGAIDADGQISKPESESETDNKESSAKSNPAPLKSFKPSEEIAAEQAVDFPVDI